MTEYRSNRSGGDGNTKSPPSKKKRQHSPAKYWFFTYNNYDKYLKESSSNIYMFCDALKEHCHALVFQEEVCPTTGTPHLQGAIELKQKKRLSSLKRMFGDKISWRKTRNREAVINYCKKDYSHVGERFVYGLPKPIKLISEFRDWQKLVLSIIDTEADDRTIYWFYDREGGAGKSQLCKYLFFKKNACILGQGKGADVACAVKEHIQPKDKRERGRDLDLVIYDIPRAGKDYIDMRMLEQIKNGLIFNTKYKSRTVGCNSPHVIIFANEPPSGETYEKLTKTRWVIKNIRDMDEPEPKGEHIAHEGEWFPIDHFLPRNEIENYEPLRVLAEE